MKSNSGYWSCFVHAVRDRHGALYHNWRVAFNWPGRAQWKVKAPAVLCESCRVTPNVECRRKDCAEAAWKWAQQELRRWNVQMRETGKVTDFAELAPSKRAAVVNGTWADLEAVWDENWKLVIRSETAARGCRNAARRVIANAFDLWVSGKGRNGVHEGKETPDAGRIAKLRLSDVLHFDTARRYFAALVPAGFQTAERPEHVTINSTLKMFRDMFSNGAMERIWEGRIVLPDSLGRFKTYPLLSQPASEPEPIGPEKFAELVARSEGLRESDPDLWLYARIARQTALRRGSMLVLRGEWVRQINGHWWLDVEVRKHGTDKYSVPILAETAAVIRERGAGFLFGADEQARSRVDERHAEFIVSVIGAPSRGHQKMHRLRDTLAGALYSFTKSIEAAKVALGHVDVATTLRHYSRCPADVSEMMRREFAAFL